MKIIVTIVWCAIVLLFSAGEVLSTEYPIIGIVSQEQTDPVVAEKFPNAKTYIYATYVKAVESTGARVVPILPGKDESHYRNLLSCINGVILPGGDSPMAPGNPYYDTAKIIYNIAMELNDSGSFFPVLAVCLGFEFLAIFAQDEQPILRNCLIIHENCPLRFLLPPLETYLYSQMTLNEYYTLQYSKSTANIHTWCLLPDDFDRNARLKDNWKITAISQCEKNEPQFVASLEHKRFPILGVQFHPEVIPFEWSNVTLYPRSWDVVRASRYFYDTLVNYARQNNHAFENEGDENPLLIYNYPIFYTRYNTGRYRQIYLF